MYCIKALVIVFFADYNIRVNGVVVQQSIRGFSQVAKVMRSARPSLSVVHCACRSRYQVLMLKTIVSTVEQV